MEQILVIDDDKLFREMILLALEEAGYPTIEADGGQEGVERARTETPSLIICDLRMNGLDGYGVLKALRGDTATAAIPVILMTGMADQERMREGMNLGADDYLSKPFLVEDLLRAVRMRLQKRRAMQKQIEQKLQDLRASITMALPHELRTPLNGIITSAEILEQDGPDMSSDEIREFAGMIRSSSRRLQRLIENFLIYAQLEVLARDEQQIALLRKNQSRGLELVIRRRAENLGHGCHRFDDLSFDVDDGVVAISEEYLGKIVEELIDNAFKFSEPGTPVHVHAATDADFFALQVTDQGIGMETERIEDIGAYMQFGRAMQEQQGTGLGLQIVRSLATLHGGAIEITSEAGTGTQVRCLLPLAQTSSRSRDHAPTARRLA
ncbi:MAG: hybrid sensor histidine kinase/response regulator [Bacteroidota bacterium]